MTELVVDGKYRVTLPRHVRRRLGIGRGTRLEAESKGTEIVIRKAVPVRNPTERLWRLVSAVRERNPKMTARRAIASRNKLGK